MLKNDQSATLESTDPTAIRPLKKQGTLKMLLRQLEATNNPPLVGEEVLPPHLAGDGNYHWYPLAWTRWLVRWERLKTLGLLVILVLLLLVLLVMTKRKSYEVALPEPSTELLLRSKGFDTFNRNQAEAFVLSVVSAANQSSSEGMPNLTLLEGSVDPVIYLRLQQRGLEASNAKVSVEDYPIHTIYVAETTRWIYNPAKRVISTYVKGFRMTNTISGSGGMESYRALVEIFWEPTSNRNRWGYYLQRFDEFFGPAAEAYDVEQKHRDASHF